MSLQIGDAFTKMITNEAVVYEQTVAHMYSQKMAEYHEMKSFIKLNMANGKLKKGFTTHDIANIYIKQCRMPFVKEIRDCLEKHGMSQAKFAELVGVNPRTMRRWLTGKHSIPSYATLTAKALDTHPKFILDIIKNKERNSRWNIANK